MGRWRGDARSWFRGGREGREGLIFSEKSGIPALPALDNVISVHLPRFLGLRADPYCQGVRFMKEGRRIPEGRHHNEGKTIC
jgi:hypothetical protein